MIQQEENKAYYAVIFTSTLTQQSSEEYEGMAGEMEELASKQPGFLGIESARNTLGITISYWESLEAIQQWKANIDHQKAQTLGKKVWYQNYTVRIAKIEREYSFKKI